MSNIYTLAEAVRRLEDTPDTAQKLFSELMYRHYYRKKEAVMGVHIDHLEGINALENAGLLLCIDDPKPQPGSINVVITPALEKGWRKVYTYLNWKFEDDGYFDDEWHDFPKGAKYIGKVGIFTGKSESGWYYPDNDVSRLLEKYGHLRCPIWDGPKEDFRD